MWGADAPTKDTALAVGDATVKVTETAVAPGVLAVMVTGPLHSVPAADTDE